MTNPHLPNVALIGRMGSGKSTIAALLSEIYGYQRFSWATPVKDIAALAYGPIDKGQAYEVSVDGRDTTRTGREILQRIGTDAMRQQVDDNFWIRAGVRRIEARPDLTWVNDDTRFQNEADALARRGWILVRVKVPEHVRLARLREVNPALTNEMLNHPSETQSDSIGVHFELWNTSSPLSVTETLLHTLAHISLQGARP